jgi:hypothetical protein
MMRFQNFSSPHSHIFVLSSSVVLLAASLFVTGCKKNDEGSGAPPPAQVTHVSDMNLITVDQSKVNQFPLVTPQDCFAVVCDRLGESRCITNGAGHLAGERTCCRYPRPP